MPSSASNCSLYTCLGPALYVLQKQKLKFSFVAWLALVNSRHSCKCLQKDQTIRAQRLLRWATVPEQSKPKSGGAAVPLSMGELGPHITQCRLGQSLPTKCYRDPSSRLAIIDMGRNEGGGCCAHFLFGAARSPSNTMSPGPRPTSVPSGSLIHPTVWPYRHL